MMKRIKLVSGALCLCAVVGVMVVPQFQGMSAIEILAILGALVVVFSVMALGLWLIGSAVYPNEHGPPNPRPTPKPRPKGYQQETIDDMMEGWGYTKTDSGSNVVEPLPTAFDEVDGT